MSREMSPDVNYITKKENFRSGNGEQTRDINFFSFLKSYDLKASVFGVQEYGVY